MGNRGSCDGEGKGDLLMLRTQSASNPSESLRNESSGRSGVINPWSEEEEVLEAVKLNGMELRHVRDEFKNNFEIVLESVKENGHSLIYAGDEMKNNKEIVLEAVKENGCALVYASEELRNTEEVVIEAVQNDGKAFRYASIELKNDPRFIKLFQFKDGGEVLLLGKGIRQNEEVLKETFSENVSVSSRITLPFFSEDVNEKDEEYQMSILTSRFGYLLENRRVMDVFEQRPKDSVSEVHRAGKHANDGSDFKINIIDDFIDAEKLFLCSYNLIGTGCFGSSYKIKIYENYADHDFRMTSVFKSLQTQSSGEDEHGSYTLFVVKIYHDLLSEEKRKENVDKDRLDIPYHKNVASVWYSRSNETVDFSALPDYEDRWKERIPSRSSMETGVLIMKYYKQDLEGYMKKRILRGLDPSSLSKLEFCRILRGIIHGLFHLHSNFIVHRDLHPRNIFVNEFYGRVWIGDFGCCLDLRKKVKKNDHLLNLTNNPFLVHIDEEILYSKLSFTCSSSEDNYLRLNKGGCLKYLAPEIVNFRAELESRLDFSKSDLYSVGVLGLFLLFFDRDEVKGKEESSTCMRNLLTVSECYSDEVLHDFIQNHLKGSVQERISFEESKAQIDEIIRYPMENRVLGSGESVPINKKFSNVREMYYAMKGNLDIESLKRFIEDDTDEDENSSDSSSDDSGSDESDGI